MPELPLITPDVVEDVLLDIVRRRHPEHLAKLERQLGLTLETLERYRTVSHMASDEAQGALSGDTLPAILLAVIGGDGAPVRTEEDKLNVAMLVAVQVSVIGQRRRDTLRRRDWMTWTTIECLLERTPRRGPIDSIRLVDWEPVAQSEAKRILAESRLVFSVSVADAVTVVGGLPADDTPWPSGGPNGPPTAPYVPPDSDPLPATDFTFTTNKERIDT
jgi:hypothetical protein